MKWRPIETAPQDGTEILLYEPGYFTGADRGVVTTGYYCHEHTHINGGYFKNGRCAIMATHWMPLPVAPPKKEKG